jgi:hypothetical protein
VRKQATFGAPVAVACVLAREHAIVAVNISPTSRVSFVAAGSLMPSRYGVFGTTYCPDASRSWEYRTRGRT